MGRVIWIILDSVGMGELPDAERFGDAGANTIAHIWEYNKGLNILNMIKLGYGNIDGMMSVDKTDSPAGAYGRCMEMSNGKDTTVGHWEMTGVISEKAFPVFENGFPDAVIDEFIKKTGINNVLGNCVASGTEILEKLGDECINTEQPIVYTSADSVFQIAYFVGCDDDYSKTDANKVQELYRLCKTARDILTGEYEVARVIARPFVKDGDNFVRTGDRRDYAILPPDYNLLNRLKEQGYEVAAVGKIEDIFAGSGITTAKHTGNNMEGMDATLEYMKEVKEGLIFTNLVEFDSTWGHRRDAAGYGKGLEEFDLRLAEVIDAMKDDDILIINSDHGCDPTFKGTDHTREYIPVLVYGKKIKGINFGTRNSFADIGQTIADYLGVEPIINGESILDIIEV